jgi:hypothetical protein
LDKYPRTEKDKKIETKEFKESQQVMQEQKKVQEGAAPTSCE